MRAREERISAAVARRWSISWMIEGKMGIGACVLSVSPPHTLARHLQALVTSFSVTCTSLGRRCHSCRITHATLFRYIALKISPFHVFCSFALLYMLANLCVGEIRC